MNKRYVGFYWTRPVFWAGLRHDFDDLVDAERRSRTIRYQMAAARRHVSQNSGILIDEFAYLEIAEDRATDILVPALQKVIELCDVKNARLLYVNFRERRGWREHPQLDKLLSNYDRCDPIAPEPIDGFDPISHFETWERARISERPDKRRRILSELVETARRFIGERGAYSRISQSLNERRISTFSNRPWTAENVRMYLNRYPDIVSEIPTGVLLDGVLLNRLTSAAVTSNALLPLK